MPSSSIPGFFVKNRNERLKILAEFTDLESDDIVTLQDTSGLTFEAADRMIENAIGTFALPLGIATNFKVNGKDYLIPMVIEEPSVVAAASKGAKTARPHGGFSVVVDEPYSIGQIQVLGAESDATLNIKKSTQKILALANSKSRTLSTMNKGAKNVSCREIDTPSGKMLIVELLIDVGDAMGANVTNTMCEAVAPLIEELSGGRTLLKILSNYSTSRMVRATATFDSEMIGNSAIDDIILAFEFADNDVYRAVTHNKGIMNGIISVANATGQDSRAIEAAANAYAASTGRYRSLSRWSKDTNGNLVGTLELPLAVGIVGGIANTHPTAKICNKILCVKSAQELACIIASVGLAQNFSALRALSVEGIQHGHMRLHARNLVISAGVMPDLVDKIVDKMIREGNISSSRAKEILEQI